MKKFEYKQVEYSKYPSVEDLDKEGKEGWELIKIYQFKKTFYDSDVMMHYNQNIYLATFKREIYGSN